MTPDDDIITIKTPDGSDFVTIPVPDHNDTMMASITVDDKVRLSYSDGESGDSCDTFTYTDTFESIKWNELFDTPDEMKIGDHVLTADMVEKLGALIDMIEGLDDDNAIKELFNAQLVMNKIRGNNET